MAEGALPRTSSAIAALTLMLVGASAWLPSIPLFGPVAADDALVVAAVGVGGILALARPLGRFDLLLVPLWGMLLLGWCSNLLQAGGPSFVSLARGPARTLLWVLLLLVVHSAAVQLGSKRALGVLCGAAAVEALFGVVAFLSRYSGPYNIGVYLSHGASLEGARLVGTFNLADGRGMNGLAAYFALFVPATVLLAFLSLGWRRRLWLLAAAAQLLALLWTYTRSTLLALTLGVLAAVWLAGKRRWVMPALLAAALAVLLAPGLLGRFVGQGTDRPALAWAAAEIGSEAPWLGHGDFDYVGYLFGRSTTFNTPVGVASNTPHNSVLLGYVRYGVLGAVLVILLLATPVVVFSRRAITRRKTARLAALFGVVAFVAFAVQSLSNNLLEVPKTSVFFWSLWVVLDMASSVPKQEGQPRPTYEAEVSCASSA